MTLETELKLALSKGIVSLGSRSAEKLAKKGKAAYVVVASNCPQNILGNLNKSGVKIEKFEGAGKQLGIFCGKPFPVAVLTVTEEKKKK